MKKVIALILVLVISLVSPVCCAFADDGGYDFSDWDNGQMEFLSEQVKEEMSKRGLTVPEQTSDDWNLQCTKCGKSIPDSSSFCLYCGTALRSAGDSSTVLQTETGKAEIIGLLPVPAEFLSDKNADPSKFTIVVVKYTNFTDEERQFQKEFQMKAYQNGVELSTVGSYRSGASQEVENFFKNVLLNGSITVGRAYVLDGTSDITVIVSSSSKETVKAVYSLDGGTVVGNSSSSEEDTKHSEMLTQYADVISALDGGEWFFAGDEVTVLNRLRFTQDSALLGQVYYDGNGKHENGERNYTYRVNDSDITVTLIDGSEYAIPYTLTGNDIRLGSGDYFTLREIEESIQGHWMYKETSDNSYLGLRPTGHEYHIMIDHGMLYSEYAAENVRETNGAYYYYGPEQGNYKLNFGGFDTNMRHGNEWFFSIADGQPVIMRYTHVCYRSNESSFPGRDGYYF